MEDIIDLVLRVLSRKSRRWKPKIPVIFRTEGRFGKEITYLESTRQDLQNGTHFSKFKI